MKRGTHSGGVSFRHVLQPALVAGSFEHEEFLPIRDFGLDSDDSVFNTQRCDAAEREKL